MGTSSKGVTKCNNNTKFGSIYFIYLIVLIFMMNLKLCVSDISTISEQSSGSHNKITNNHYNYHNSTRNYSRNIKEIWRNIDALKSGHRRNHLLDHNYQKQNLRELNSNRLHTHHHQQHHNQHLHHYNKRHGVRHNHQKLNSTHENRLRNYLNSRYKTNNHLIADRSFLTAYRTTTRTTTTTARSTDLQINAIDGEYDYADYGSDDANISLKNSANPPSNGRASRVSI
jgi:hypothetical protein